MTDRTLSPLFYQSEHYVITAVEWLRLIVEIMGAAVIGVGVVVAAVGCVKVMLGQDGGSFHRVRLTLARYLSLGLEFQLGADILATAVAPSWEQIGKLAAIALIRTGLNYFLMQEMKAAERDWKRRDKWLKRQEKKHLETDNPLDQSKH